MHHTSADVSIRQQIRQHTCTNETAESSSTASSLTECTISEQPSASAAHLFTCIRQHTSAYVRIRPHTSAYVSIRQHTSAYVSSTSSLEACAHKMSASVLPTPRTVAICLRPGEMVAACRQLSTQFTCFTGTKAICLRPGEMAAAVCLPQFTCALTCLSLLAYLVLSLLA